MRRFTDSPVVRHPRQDLAQFRGAHQFHQRHLRREWDWALPPTRANDALAKVMRKLPVHGEHAFHHAGQNRFALRRLHAQPVHQVAKLHGGGAERAPQRAQFVIGDPAAALGKSARPPTLPQRRAAARCAG